MPIREFLVIDCAFNRECYPSLIGKRFANPPAYVVVVEVEG